MSHQDDLHIRKNIQEFKSILEDAISKEVKNFTRHGNAQLDTAWLVSVALTCWGFMTGTLSHRVGAACKVVGHVFGTSDTVSRQGLLKALASCGPSLLELMIDALPQRIKGLKGSWTQNGKVNVAVDGTKFAAPRTKANQEYFSAAHKQKKKAGQEAKSKTYQQPADQSKAATVQILVTVFFHMVSGLPLRWKVSASNGSERQDARAMLPTLPRNARLIGDAEYVGYSLWSEIHNSGRTFLVRVGSNMTFLNYIGKYKMVDGLVYYWPDYQMKANQPALVLRLIQLHDGNKAVYLVTNELDMTDKVASQLYAQRWKIEVFFRTVKQTCECAKLQCLRPENVLTELNWTLLGIWYALLTAKSVCKEQGTNIQRISPVKVMNAFTKVVELIHRIATEVTLFRTELANATVADESDRTSSKASRNYPRKKKHRRCGKPNIYDPTPEQQKLALQLQV
jgi:hypothetical protein